MAPLTNLHGISMVGFHFKMWNSISLKPEQRESQGQLIKVIGYTMLAQRTGSPVVEELVVLLNKFVFVNVCHILVPLKYGAQVRGRRPLLPGYN